MVFFIIHVCFLAVMNYTYIMEKTTQTKYRLLEVLNIFQKYSDESHPISLSFILDKLANINIDASKYALYDDINTLNEMNHHILYKRNIGYYYIPNISDVELKVIVDAIDSINTLSLTKTNELVNTLLDKHSIYTNDLIDKTRVYNHQKHHNNHSLINIEYVLRSISNDSEISFSYFDYDINHHKQYRKNKKSYYLIPYGLVLSNQYYYCIGYNEKYNSFQHYRLDKMENIQLGKQKEKINFNLSDYTSRFINMYIDDKTNITLRVDNSLANTILDRFSNQIIITSTSDTHFEVNINVDPSMPFIAWLLSFKKAIVVVKPQSLINRIALIIEELSTIYPKN